MEDISTAAPVRNFRIEDEAVTLGEVVGGQAEYTKAIFVAIARLASDPQMVGTVVGLARCGQWVSENMDTEVDYMVSNIIDRCKRSAA